MNILFIDPSVGTGDGLNTGLGWLAASVEKAKHGARVLDLVNRRQLSFENTVLLIKENIERLNPDIVGFCIHSITIGISIKLIKEIRTFYKGLIIIGGPQMAFEHKEIFRKIPDIDFAVVGEAEDTLPELMNELGRKQKDLCRIDGLIWKNGNEIIENKQRKPREDINTLPYPDYSRHFGLKKIKAHYSLMTSRGCPYGCSFCNSHMSGKKWRKRSLDNVIEELKKAISVYGIKEFMIQEPVFNLKPERVIEFCNKLKINAIKLPWFIPSGVRADRLTPESIDAMKRSGCTELKIGVETLVPEVFPGVNKGMSLEKLMDVCKMIKRSSFPLRGSFIIGLPGDNYKNSIKNYNLSKKLGFRTTDWSLLIPYPGTKIYEWVKNYGKILYDYCSADQGSFQVTKPENIKIAFDTPDFSANDRLKAFIKISVKSGSYIFDRSASKIGIIASLLMQVIKYDALNLPFHLVNIYKKYKIQKERGSSKEIRYIFEDLSPF